MVVQGDANAGLGWTEVDGMVTAVGRMPRQSRVSPWLPLALPTEPDLEATSRWTTGKQIDSIAVSRLRHEG